MHRFASADSIVLIITKVEDPEELDTRFARFAPSVHEEMGEDEEEVSGGTDEVLDLFRRLQGSEELPSGDAPGAKPSSDAGNPPTMRMLKFSSLHLLLSAAATVSGGISGGSSLYKDAREDCYLLLLSHPQKDASDFNRCCNILSEYGSFTKVTPSTPSYLEEHCETLLLENALQALAQI